MPHEKNIVQDGVKQNKVIGKDRGTMGNTFYKLENLKKYLRHEVLLID